MNREYDAIADCNTAQLLNPLLPRSYTLRAYSYLRLGNFQLAAELHFIEVKSILAIPLRNNETVHGCLILQQCDEWRVWSEDDMDFLKKIADKISVEM